VIARVVGAGRVGDDLVPGQDRRGLLVGGAPALVPGLHPAPVGGQDGRRPEHRGGRPGGHAEQGDQRFWVLVSDPGAFIMERRMLKGIKQRVEGAAVRPAA
jgi:hypothetical protein